MRRKHRKDTKSMEAEEIRDVIRRIAEGDETTFDLVKAMSGDKATSTIVIRRRKLEPERPAPPRRAESPARNHEFYSIEGFIAYLKRCAKEGHDAGMLILGDMATGEIAAVLDDDAEKGREYIDFKPSIHPLFAPWYAAIGERMPIAEFAELVMSNRRTVDNGRDIALIFSQIRASKNVVIQSGSGAKSINGVVCEMQIEGQASDHKYIDLPDTITITAPIYLATDPLKIEIDLTIVAGTGDHILVAITAAQLLEAKVKATESMFDILKDAATGDFPNAVISFGAPGEKAWDYIDPDPVDGD